MRFSLVTGPSTEPIIASELQTHANIIGEDSYLESLIVAARKQMERYLNRALITQSWKVFYDCWSYEMQIPFPPLISVSTVKYYNSAGTLTTLASSNYWVVNTQDPGMVIRRHDVSYPELQDGKPDAIEIAFTAGYGNADDVPEDIRHGIKLLATDLYEHRGTKVVGTISGEIPGYLVDLVHSYKVYQF